MKMTRAVALAAGVLLLTACSSVSTDPNQIALHYNHGPVEDTTFNECVNPGIQHNADGFDEEYFVYPTGDRTYKFDNDAKGAEQGSITVVSKDNVRLTVAGILSFRLDTTCKVLQQFHEKIGIKYGASATGVKRWTELLQDYLGVALINEMVAQALNYTWSELYRNTDGAKDKWLAAVLKGLPHSVESIAKAPYFGTFTMLVPQPQPPSQLLNQITEQQVQNERINTINAQKAAQDAEIAQMQQLVQLLGPDGYIRYRNQLQCEQESDSCVPYLPIPAGSNINVTPGG